MVESDPALAETGSPARGERRRRRPNEVGALSRFRRGTADCAVPVLYLILRFLEDLAISGGSDPA